MILVLSPHLDDAVFGCGQLLAAAPSAVVATVFAGSPPAYPTVTPWDAAAGFAPGDDVVAARREEDRTALSLLGAQPRWLSFLDAQYAPSPPVERLAEAIATVVADVAPATVVMPLGLFHSDHRLAHDAALAVLRSDRGRDWLAYEDAIYRAIPGAVRDRLAHVAAAGVTATRASGIGAGDVERKRRAVLAYRSQLRALSAPGHPGYEDALGADTYWRLAA